MTGGRIFRTPEYLRVVRYKPEVGPSSPERDEDAMARDVRWRQWSCWLTLVPYSPTRAHESIDLVLRPAPERGGRRMDILLILHRRSINQHVQDCEMPSQGGV